MWQEVLYDCDAELENVTANAVGGLVPLGDQSGYVQLQPTGVGAAPTEARMAALFAAVNGPIGGPADCAIRIGNTLDMQVSGIFADAATQDAVPFFPAFRGGLRLAQLPQPDNGAPSASTTPPAKPRRSTRATAFPSRVAPGSRTIQRGGSVPRQPHDRIRPADVHLVQPDSVPESRRIDPERAEHTCEPAAPAVADPGSR